MLNQLASIKEFDAVLKNDDWSPEGIEKYKRRTRIMLANIIGILLSRYVLF